MAAPSTISDLVATLSDAKEAVQAWLIPASAVVFFIYPVVLLIWTALEGRAAATAANAKSTACQPFADKLCGSNAFAGKPDLLKHSGRRGKQDKVVMPHKPMMARPTTSSVCLVLMVATVVISSIGTALAFAVRGPGMSPRQCSQGSTFESSAEFTSSVVPPKGGLVVRPKKVDRKGLGQMRTGLGQVSLWHDIKLQKTWLDEATGLFHYVNEIPRGEFQKWEVQTKVPHNVIAEHVKGTKKLHAFGRAVPFNYGCFPQTYRDPNVLDSIYNAPGDDDPLDVIDLTPEPVGVGKIARCRPLGTVCLIDEGRADWKVFVVNVESYSLLSFARSMEDVERIAPGRLEEAMNWLRDFKLMSSREGSETTLHMEIHSAAHARALIAADHKAWRQLKDRADENGRANGHWIRDPVPATDPQPSGMLVFQGR